MERANNAKKLWIIIASLFIALLCALCIVACGNTDGADGNLNGNSNIGSTGDDPDDSDNTPDDPDDSDGHTRHSYVETDVPPTCVERGYTLYKCSCGDEYKDKYVDATGVHSFGDYVFDNNATCIADGTETATCENCTATDTRTKEGTATRVHHYVDYICDWCYAIDLYAPDTAGLEYTAITFDGVTRGYKVSKGSAGNNKYIKVPTSHENKPILDVAAHGFEGCSRIVSVDLPYCVSDIEEYAFSGCSGLKKISMPNISDIDDYAFSGCSSLPSVEIPRSTHNFGNYAFYGCDGMTAVYFKGDVSEWCRKMFYGPFANPLQCAHNLYINNRLVTELVIPDSVNIVYGYTFSGCSITSLEIPSSVEIISGYAFQYCESLTSVEIPGSITSIGYGVFAGCKGLTSVTIQNGIKRISRETFSYCTSLTDVSIPNSVTLIEENAFSGCSSLTRLVIPASVTEVGRNIASASKSLTVYCEAISRPSGWDREWNWCSLSDTDFSSIYVPVVWNCRYNDKDASGYEYAVIGGIRYSLKSGTATVVGQPQNISGAITVPSSVTYKNEAYDVRSIVGHAFEFCAEITSVVIADSVTSIGEHAFWDCVKLKSVKISNRVTRIEDYTFLRCTSLESVEIPSGVRQIGRRAFGGSGLAQIRFYGTTEEWENIYKYAEWNLGVGEYTVACTNGTLTERGQE